MQTTEIVFLSDKKITRKGKEKERPWRWNKRLSILLYESYRRRREFKKAERCKDCGSWLEFWGTPTELGKLKNANFCKLRLCPMCGWRRSEKIFGQASRIMNYMQENYDYRYVFLTLTVRNIVGNDLSKAIDEMMKAWNHLHNKEKKFKKICKGFFRALEVTYNRESEDFHPHIHVIIAVNKRYFDKQDEKSGYLNHDEWMKLWRKCANLDYDPWVFIETVKPDEGKKVKGEITYVGAVAEVAKYTVKPGQIIIDPYQVAKNSGEGHLQQYLKKGEYHEQLTLLCQNITDGLVFELDRALKNRRLISFGGKMREVHKLLNLDDPTDGDLINTGNDELREDLNYVIRTYCWNVEFMNYVLVAEEDGQALKQE